MFTCWPVIAEAAWLLGQSAHAPKNLQSLMDGIDSGFLALLPLNSEDAAPIGSILKKYQDIKPQLADAALVHLAACNGLDTVFTLDQRDFSVYRLPKGRMFRVLPKAM